MDFATASYGVSKMGVQDFISDLNLKVLKTIAGKIADTSDIENAINAGWHGASADNFKARLKEATVELNDSLNQLSKNFNNEMEQIVSSVSEMDNSLFTE